MTKHVGPPCRSQQEGSTPAVATASARVPNRLVRLKRCLMMSPLAVSTDPESPAFQFDVVFFDKDPKVNPQDAIGAVERRHQLVHWRWACKSDPLRRAMTQGTPATAFTSVVQRLLHYSHSQKQVVQKPSSHRDKPGGGEIISCRSAYLVLESSFL